jgi:hypothetical protein
MKTRHSIHALAGAAVVTAFTLGASGAAHADSVYWSVGLSSPGVQVGLSSPQPVYAPSPVYYTPQVVYAQPQVVYVQPQPVPVYVQPRPFHHVYQVQPAPVYVAPRVVYNGWEHPGHGWHHGRYDRPHYGQPQAQAQNLAQYQQPSQPIRVSPPVPVPSQPRPAAPVTPVPYGPHSL